MEILQRMFRKLFGVAPGDARRFAAQQAQHQKELQRAEAVSERAMQEHDGAFETVCAVASLPPKRLKRDTRALSQGHLKALRAHSAR